MISQRLKLLLNLLLPAVPSPTLFIVFYVGLKIAITQDNGRMMSHGQCATIILMLLLALPHLIFLPFVVDTFMSIDICASLLNGNTMMMMMMVMKKSGKLYNDDYGVNGSHTSFTGCYSIWIQAGILCVTSPHISQLLLPYKPVDFLWGKTWMNR